jgi:hypothetical protein
MRADAYYAAVGKNDSDGSDGDGPPDAPPPLERNPTG